MSDREPTPGGFWQFAIEHFLVLPLAAVAAIVWANTYPESYYGFAFRLSFLVNDVGMVLFFGLVTKELVEASIPDGLLHTWRRTGLPILAGAGSVLVAALLYLWFVSFAEEPMLTSSWVVVCASDLAFGYFVTSSIFGRRHPAIPFFVLISIISNAIGLVMLAVFYPSGEAHVGSSLLLMGGAIGLAVVLRKNHVRSLWPYVLACGSMAWFALYLGHLHTAFALVPIIPFVPHAKRDPGMFVEAKPGARDALSHYERWFRYPVQIVLLLFGLVNGGVPIHGLEEGTWALPTATLVGRPTGMLAGVALAIALGLHHPRGLTWRDLVAISFVSAIGFTFALFFATAAMSPGPLLTQLKVGALLSVLAAVAAVASALILRVGRFAG